VLITMKVNSIADKIRLLRFQRKLKQVEFAKKIGTSQTIITAWETGKAIPSTEYLFKITKAFGISLGFFDEENGEE